MNDKDKTSSLSLLITLIVGIPLSILVALYGIFVILKLIKWFNVPLLLTYKQWFGVIAIFGLLTADLHTVKYKGFSDLISNLISKCLVYSLLLLIYWILSNLM